MTRFLRVSQVQISGRCSYRICATKDGGDEGRLDLHLMIVGHNSTNSAKKTRLGCLNTSMDGLMLFHTLEHGGF